MCSGCAGDRPSGDDARIERRERDADHDEAAAGNQSPGYGWLVTGESRWTDGGHGVTESLASSAGESDRGDGVAVTGDQTVLVERPEDAEQRQLREPERVAEFVDRGGLAGEEVQVDELGLCRGEPDGEFDDVGGVGVGRGVSGAVAVGVRVQNGVGSHHEPK